jgi:hypothetical protein
VMELVVLVGLSAMVLVPVCVLSARNTEDPEDLMERSLAWNLGMDLIERFKAYKPFWPMPRAEETYVQELKALGLDARPKVALIPDPVRTGLYRLEVTVSWTGRRGQERRLDFARLCFHP